MAPTAQNLIPSPTARGTTPSTTLVRTYVTSRRELVTTNLNIADRNNAQVDGEPGAWINNGESTVSGGLAVDVGPLATGDYVLTIRFSTSTDAARVILAPIATIAGAAYIVSPDVEEGYRITDDKSVGPRPVRPPFVAASTYRTLTIPLTIPTNRSATVSLLTSRGEETGGTLNMATAHYAVALEHGTAAFSIGLAYWRLDTAAGEAIRAGYFDGDTPDTAEMDYAWTGTPHRSTSVATLATVTPPDPEEPTVIPTPAAMSTADGYMLPELEGVRWIVDGTPTMPGTYAVQPVTETTTVTIMPEELDGYLFDAEPEPLLLTFEPAPPIDPDPVDPDPVDPDPEPEPDPEAWGRLMDDDPQALFVARRLAERIVRHTGGSLDTVTADELVTAQDHALTVIEYVRGYTRERGFVGYIPHRSLQAVIVAAAARLYVNPEQVTYYATGDYSERPATMTGWTAAELAVLRRFRRIYA